MSTIHSYQCPYISCIHDVPYTPLKRSTDQEHFFVDLKESIVYSVTSLAGGKLSLQQGHASIGNCITLPRHFSEAQSRPLSPKCLGMYIDMFLYCNE